MRRPPLLSVVLVAVTAVLGVISAGLPAVTSWDLTTGTGEVRLYLDTLEENNLPTWWATLQLFLAGASCAAVALLHRRTGQPGALVWGLLSGLVFLLSLDEMTSLHERLDRLAEGRVDLGTYPFLWVVPGLLAAVAVVVLVLALVRRISEASRRWLVAGFGLLLGAALGGELVQGLLLGAGDVGPTYVLTYHTEEFLETVGAIALATGAWAALDRAPAGSGVVLTLAR